MLIGPVVACLLAALRQIRSPIHLRRTTPPSQTEPETGPEIPGTIIEHQPATDGLPTPRDGPLPNYEAYVASIPDHFRQEQGDNVISQDNEPDNESSHQRGPFSVGYYFTTNGSRQITWSAVPRAINRRMDFPIPIVFPLVLLVN